MGGTGQQGDEAPTGAPGAGTDQAAEQTGVTPELMDRLRPFLAESLMVLDADWTILANLAPPGGLIGRGLGLGLHTLEDMHPDDALVILELGMEAFSTQHGWQASRVVRMRTGDGTWGRYEITAFNQFGDPLINGMVVRTRELPEDLAEDWQGSRPTSAIETLSELLPVGVLLLDQNGRVVFANGAACGMLSREPEELTRDGFEPVVDPVDAPLVADVLRRVTQAAGREECTIRLVGARVERVECRFTSEGRSDVASIVVTLEDVTARHATQRDLEARANRDPLTGLRNRASLQDLLEVRLAERIPTDVAYLDLDGFKAVNDTWGHERGDEVLVLVAEALRDGLGPDADVARIGGDEFVVVTDPGDREALAAEVRDLVAAVSRAEGLSVTGSVGVGRAVRGDSPHDALRRADQAMYRAKGHRP
ncbi:GGDEF domain-containing protein [Aquihabitans sp. G128]|uniref:GGDEF domain-containing protein n=1 Tax=Aquihabitans sp. G128 TaxID=2849779 RepID=UPI001C239A39|nr:GGDEF domain-containing protein [Aquihabitans sp. G128]QXC59632.1 GGDEF domain-containing protein [Aquihabitans sp. G128]